jgi:5'-methylthioinosine phosphorylase
VTKIGLIVGSGALDWQLDWETLPGRQTDYGEAAADLRTAEIHGHRLVVLARHGVPHRYAPHAVNYRANLKLLEAAGVESVIALNTVGGIADYAVSGRLAVPDQIIDYTWGRIQSFSPDDDVRHIDFSDPYDDRLRTALLDAGAGAGLSVHDGGVMGVTQGPRLETAAEIRRMAGDGCDLVGMTGMPEAALARELALPFASLALVVNPAAGLAPEPIDLEEIRAVAATGMAEITRLLDVFLQRFEGVDQAPG